MIYKKNEIIDIPSKWIVIVIVVMAILFVLGIKLTDKVAKSINYLEYHEKMDTTYVVHPSGEGVG